MNAKFSLSEWTDKIRLTPILGRYYGLNVTGPCDLVQNEKLREGLSGTIDWGDPVKTDIFVFGLGSPANSFETKIGGVPHRSLEKAWPKTSVGKSMDFLGQINFADSMDLVRFELPDDLMLVFVDSLKDPQEFHFEWGSIQLNDPCSGMPDGVDSPVECYGQISRVNNYPHAVLPDEDVVLLDGKEVMSIWQLPQYQGTQIGEAPFLPQDFEIEEGDVVFASISSLHPTPTLNFPLLNYEEPIAIDLQPQELKGLFHFVDVGAMVFYRDKQGKFCVVPGY